MYVEWELIGMSLLFFYVRLTANASMQEFVFQEHKQKCVRFVPVEKKTLDI